MNEILSYTTMEPVFELVFENPNEPTFDPKEKVRILTSTYPYACSWIKVGKKDETCGKPSKAKFCSKHRRIIRNGATIPTTCFGCRVGITRWHYLCAYCEKYSGL